MLQFSQYEKANGTTEYACCYQQGQEYIDFYTWVRTTSYQCVHADMPWDIFVFNTPADSEEFHRRYNEGIYIDTEDDV